ncbi:MAG: hypothetical protein P8Z30_05170 [Acidobacteriota bacterium]
MTSPSVTVAVLALALGYVLGGWLRVEHVRHRRRWLSLGAGVSVAYVFIQLLPELREAHGKFLTATAHRNLPFPEHRVMGAALAGFVLYYGLENLVDWSRRSMREKGLTQHSKQVVWLHVGGFAAYSLLVSYLLVDWQDRGTGAVALYGTAMFLHFLGIDHSLRREHGSAYDNEGRWALAGSVLLGWVMGSVEMLSVEVLATLQGLISGGVIINSMVMELPKEKEGRFAPFCLGAFVYSILLILAQA